MVQYAEETVFNSNAIYQDRMKSIAARGKIQHVAISVVAKGLTNVAGRRDISSPFVRLTKITNSEAGAVMEEVVGDTEVIGHNLNPRWTRAFPHDYHFGRENLIRLDVFDSVKARKTLRDMLVRNHRRMGTVVLDVGEILGSPEDYVEKELPHGGGTVVVCCAPRETDSMMAQFLTLQIRGADLSMKRMPLCGKPQPYFEVLNKRNLPAGAVWEVIYTSDKAEHAVFPYWKSFQLDLDELCHNDQEASFQVRVKCRTRVKGKPFATYEKSIGSFEAKVESVTSRISKRGNGDVDNAFILMSKSDKYRGNIVVLEADLTNTQRTFVNVDGNLSLFGKAYDTIRTFAHDVKSNFPLKTNH